MKILIALLVLLSSTSFGEGSYYIEKKTTKRGYFAKIVNDTDVDLVCYIDNRRFRLPAYTESLFYPTAQRFNWGCWEDGEDLP